MAKFNIWIEGHQATGDSSKAQLMASNVEGRTFRDAVIKFSKTSQAKDWGVFNPKDLSFWACRCYPTEEQARKSFG